MAKNEVATTEKNFNLVTLTGELKEAVAEEMDGLGNLPFDRAKWIVNTFSDKFF